MNLPMVRINVSKTLKTAMYTEMDKFLLWGWIITWNEDKLRPPQTPSLLCVCVFRSCSLLWFSFSCYAHVVRQFHVDYCSLASSWLIPFFQGPVQFCVIPAPQSRTWVCKLWNCQLALIPSSNPLAPIFFVRITAKESFSLVPFVQNKE